HATRKLLVGPHRSAALHGSLHQLSPHPSASSRTHKHSRPGSGPLHEIAQPRRALRARSCDAASLVLLAAQPRPSATRRSPRVTTQLRRNFCALRNRAPFCWSNTTLLGDDAFAGPRVAVALVSIR